MKTFIRESTLNISSLMNHGFGNGYVVIPKGHKLNGLNHEDIDVDVHGGLTFSERAVNLEWEETKNLKPDDWIVGFDTAHYGDSLETWPKERVIEETEHLRNQLIALLNNEDQANQRI